VFFHRLCPAVIALDIQASFGLSGTLLGIFGSAYFYSYAIMQLPTGLMADSWGPRKTVSVFFVLAGIGSVLMGISPNLSVAIIGRVLVGLGVSTIFVCNFKLLSEWFTARQFVIMGGAFMAMGGIGALSSSAPLAWVSNVIGWRMTLIAVGIITLIMAILVYAFVRNRPSEMGLTPIRKDRDETEPTISLADGIKMVVTTGRFWLISIWAFCVIGIGFAVGGLWGGPYLMQVYGLSKTAAGGVLSTFALALIFGSPLVGWLANRWGRKPVIICSSLVLMEQHDAADAVYPILLFFPCQWLCRAHYRCSLQRTISYFHFRDFRRYGQSLSVHRGGGFSSAHRSRIDCREPRTGGVFD
jgi:sugar phosphate permease